MKTLNKGENITQDSGYIQEVISFNNHKFKLVASLRNGGNDIEALLMDGDGVFQYVIGKQDVPFRYTASYVSDPGRKKKDLDLAIEALKETIKAIYS